MLAEKSNVQSNGFFLCPHEIGAKSTQLRPG
uniref:Uncharacterized protein n=1 Tax=Arundo donax TaxID=35708 RepID=A0A0A8Z3F7_ARUDO